MNIVGRSGQQRAAREDVGAAMRDVFVRIGLIGENLGELDALEVDDLIVQCSYR